jgi:hypothetical protein
LPVDVSSIGSVADRSVFRHDAERADGRQRAAVFAVKLVHSVAVNDQFPLIATRQIKVVHQSVAGIVWNPVARVV